MDGRVLVRPLQRFTERQESTDATPRSLGSRGGDGHIAGCREGNLEQGPRSIDGIGQGEGKIGTDPKDSLIRSADQFHHGTLATEQSMLSWTQMGGGHCGLE
jgi:hypothetical protein